MKPPLNILRFGGDGKCSDCGKVEELRPYGKDGALVCFACMMKDEAEGHRQFGKILEQPGITILDTRPSTPPPPAANQKEQT